MRILAAIAIALGIAVLASAAFAYGPAMGGWGGGWGGHMMGSGYHMGGPWAAQAGQTWGNGTAQGYAAPSGRMGYGPGNGWCFNGQSAANGWGAPAPPATQGAPGARR